MKKSNAKPVTAALSAAFLATAISPLASAEVNPFSATPLTAGYDVVSAGEHEGKCGEGKCGEGEDKTAEGKCGEGKCGESEEKSAEGKCGEGKCGG